MNINAQRTETLSYSIISCDTTSNCNIRCRFCFNNWDKIGANVNMDEGTFKKVLELLPLVKNERFFLSCLFEPFINKSFIDYLSYIPYKYRTKCFFTTNLSLPLSDEQIDKLARANVNHINISMESLNESTYNELCEKSNFKNYYDNLIRLTNKFKSAENSPQLRYITMILKENYFELPFIAYRCNKEFYASVNEFRTPYVGPNMRLEWLDNQILDKKSLSVLSEILNCFGTSLVIDNSTNTDNYNATIQKKRFLSQEDFEKKETKDRYFELRINSSGIVKVYGQNKCYDLKEIENPYEFFYNILIDLYKNKIKESECIFDDISFKDVDSNLFCIDKFSASDSIAEIEGWAALEGHDMSQVEKYIVVNSQNIKKIYCVQNKERPDVASVLDNDMYLSSGFNTQISTEGMGSQLSIAMIFKTKDNVYYRTMYNDNLLLK